MLSPSSVMSYLWISRKSLSFFDLDPMTLSLVVAWRRYIITNEVIDDVDNTILAISASFETLDGHPESVYPSKI